MGDAVDCWVDPNGHPHHIHRSELRAFANGREGLVASNLENHIANPRSDQKCGGWRLLDRMWHIYHVDAPKVLVPVIGTLDQFFASCQSASDGREVLTSRESLRKLLSGTYNGGKPYNKWQRCKLASDDAEKSLWARLGQSVPVSALLLPACSRS